MSVMLQDSSDGHAFEARVIVFPASNFTGSPQVANFHNGAVGSKMGDTIQLKYYGCAGIIGLGGVVLAGSLESSGFTYPLRPCASIRITAIDFPASGQQFGLYRSGGKIILGAGLSGPTGTVETELLAGALTLAGTQTCTDLGDGIALLDLSHGSGVIAGP
jgi:hypothetical protein